MVNVREEESRAGGNKVRASVKGVGDWWEADS